MSSDINQSSYKDVDANLINKSLEELNLDTDTTSNPSSAQTPSQSPSQSPSIIENEGNVIRDIIHTIDDVYCYSRTHIENNYFNISDNEDFNLVFPNIYIGNYSTSTNLQLLKDLGITNIISVIPSFNPPFPTEFEYKHIEAYDDNWQELGHLFNPMNNYIAECLNKGGRIFIHCMVGRSRSVTMFLAFLISVIKGEFNHYSIDLTAGTTTSSNIVEYRKLSTKTALNVVEIGERVTRIEQPKPQLGQKEENFILYKKEQLLNHINDLITKYNSLKSRLDGEFPREEKDRNEMILELVKYVQKYRPIALPNSNFLQQLANYL